MTMRVTAPLPRKHSTPSCPMNARIGQQSTPFSAGSGIRRSMLPRPKALARWRKRWGAVTRGWRFSCPPRRRCSARRSPGYTQRDWRGTRCGSGWKSRWALILRQAARSTTPSPKYFQRTARSASTIIWARKRCRTFSRCALAIPCSNRCGMRAGSTMSRSRCRKPSGWRGARAIITGRALCATWCRTIYCNYSRSSRWSRLHGSTARPFATKRSRCCARCAQSARMKPRT